MIIYIFYVTCQSRRKLFNIEATKSKKGTLSYWRRRPHYGWGRRARGKILILNPF